MRRTEALALLAKYAPAVKPGRSPADTLLAQVQANGHQLGMDNKTGDWVILSADQSTVLVRQA